MATPRKHWFRVADSILHEGWDNDSTATFVRLAAYLNTRWARDGKSGVDAGSAVCPPAVLELLTGCRSLARARRVLHGLAMRITLTVHEQGVDTIISWPKWPIFQGLQPDLRNEPQPDAPELIPPPQDAPSPARRKTQDKKESRAPRAPSPIPNAEATRVKKPPDSGALRAAELLDSLLGERGVSRLRTHGYLDAWAREIERLAREASDLHGLDPPWPMIEAGIRWVLGPENTGRAKYAIRVECGKSLREKWPRIEAAARSARSESGPTAEFLKFRDDYIAGRA